MPLLLHDHRHRVAALGHLDRGLQQVGEGQLAEALGQRDPAGHRARHRDAVPAARGRLARIGGVAVAEIGRRPGARGGPRRIEPVQPGAVPHDAERVGAEPVAHRLDDRHHGGGGDRGVDRVSAARQHALARLRGHRVRGGDDVAAEHRQAPARIPGVPVEERVHAHRPDSRSRLTRLPAPAGAAAGCPTTPPPR